MENQFQDHSKASSEIEEHLQVLKQRNKIQEHSRILYEHWT